MCGRTDVSVVMGMVLSEIEARTGGLPTLREKLDGGRAQNGT